MLAISVAILTAVVLRTCVCSTYLVPSAGMENSLYRGERILVNKWKYGLRLPCMPLWGYHRWCTKPVGKEDIVVFNNPGNLQEPYIERRETFISRCIGIPGDTLMVDSLFNVQPSEKIAPDQKFLYSYPKLREPELDTLMAKLAIHSYGVLGQDSSRNIRSFSRYEYYLIQQAIEEDSCWVLPAEESPDVSLLPPRLLIVPGRGTTVHVYPWNMALLCNTLVLHEQREAAIHDGILYVDGEPVQDCTFTKDYYWMVANSTANVQDSRLFGFVPEDHLIGKAAVIWYSKEDNSGPFNGYRWERFFKKIE